MREAGDVCFADAFKDGSGVVEFLRYEDMKYAIKKLDDSRFRSHEVSLLSFEIRKYPWFLMCKHDNGIFIIIYLSFTCGFLL